MQYSSPIGMLCCMTLFGILFACILSNVHGEFSEMTLPVRPSIYGVPCPIEIIVLTGEPHRTASADVRIGQGGSIPKLPDSVRRCYCQINDEPTLYPAPSYIDPMGEYGSRQTFSATMEVHKFHWRCEEVTISLPVSIIYPVVFLYDKNYGDAFAFKVSEKTTIFHNYHFHHVPGTPSPRQNMLYYQHSQSAVRVPVGGSSVSPFSGSTAVSPLPAAAATPPPPAAAAASTTNYVDPVTLSAVFTFQKHNDDQSVFYLDHPLLNIGTFTSIYDAASSAELPIIRAWAMSFLRMIHRDTIQRVSTDLPSDADENAQDQPPVATGISCTGANDSISRGLLEFISIDHTIVPRLTLNTSSILTCTFTLSFTPDIIGYVMNSTDTSQKMGRVITHGVDPPVIDELEIQPIAFIPFHTTSPHDDEEMTIHGLLQQSGQIEPPPAPRRSLHIWHSPHYLNNFVDGFEFGIVATNIHINDDGDIFSHDHTQKIYVGVEFPFISLNPTAELDISGASGTSGRNTLSMKSTLRNVQRRHDYLPGLTCWKHQNIYQYSSRNDGTNIVSEAYDREDFYFEVNRSFLMSGKGCRIRLVRRPRDNAGIAALRLRFFSPDDERDDQWGTTHPIAIFDPMYHTKHLIGSFMFYDTSMVVPSKLPHITPIQFKRHVREEDGMIFMQGTMNIQYLLTAPSIQFGTDIFNLHLVLADFVHSQQFKIIGDVIRITIISHDHIVFHHDVPLVYTSSLAMDGIFPQDPDPIEVLFQHGNPIHSPTIIVPLLLILHSLHPINITVDIPVDHETSIDMDHVNIYPILLPYTDSLVNRYLNEFALITPVLPSPLTGFFYRCVAWDSIAGHYVYDANQPSPLLDTDSFECPSYISPETGLIDVSDTEIWKRVETKWTVGMEFMESCFYQLPAVCVTRSSTVSDAYDVHPLADCPSFLGAMHAVPCSLVEDDNDEPNWGYFLSDFRGLYHPERHTAELTWKYTGDPRLTVNISVQAQGIDSSGVEFTSPWIPLSTSIPAALTLSQDNMDVYSFSVPLPYFSDSANALRFRLILNGPPNHELLTTVVYNPLSELLSSCSPDENKVFDALTLLCTCDPGYQVTNPAVDVAPAAAITGTAADEIDNPLRSPQDFTCTSMCPEQFPWDASLARCSCSEDEYLDIYCQKPVPVEICHIIPDGVTPPFFTDPCGYGMAGGHRCTSCVCFDGWKENPEDHGRCTSCELEDICIHAHTSPLTFEPEYCQVGKCICLHGFAGPSCEYRVLYGAIKYVNLATKAQQDDPDLYAATQEAPRLLPRKELMAVEAQVRSSIQASMGDTPIRVFIQQVSQWLIADGKIVVTSILVAIARASLDPHRFIPTLQDQSQTYAATPHYQVGSRHKIYSTNMEIKNDDDEHNNDDDASNPTVDQLDDIHYAWKQLQNQYRHRPISIDDTFGTLDAINPLLDPLCKDEDDAQACPSGDIILPPPEDFIDAEDLHEIEHVPTILIPDDDDDDDDDDGESQPSDHTTTYIIVGVLLGIVFLLILLIVLIVFYCKRHHKACFAKHQDTGTASATEQPPSSGVQDTAPHVDEVEMV